MKKFITCLIAGLFMGTILVTATVAIASQDILVYVNSKLIHSDVPAFIQDGRTMVSLRFVAEALGAQVRWDNAKRSVYITTQPLDAGAIESNIDGDFEGWEGETIFKLENGQIWQQDSYDYTYHYAYRPEVVIYFINGQYKMRVEGVDNAIYVKRLK